jgi:hypothetical protein
MKHLYKIYSVLFFLTMTVACQEEYEPKPATYSDLLTGGESKTWQQVSFTFIFEDEDLENYDANLIYDVPECEQDDKYIFTKTGKQVEIYDGENKCDPETEDLLFKTEWDISNASASLFIGSSDFILSKLTDDSLVYGFRDTLSAPIGTDTYWEYPGEAQWVYKAID